MNPYQEAMLRFANVLGVASLFVEDGEVYELQEKLVAECRERGIPFVATMP